MNDRSFVRKMETQILSDYCVGVAIFAHDTRERGAIRARVRKLLMRKEFLCALTRRRREQGIHTKQVLAVRCSRRVGQCNHTITVHSG